MNERINQINIAYSAMQDRLLLRVSTSSSAEFRVWLTRRFVKLLLNLLIKEMDKRGGMPNVAGSEETTSMIKQGALEKKYEETESTYPFGEEGILAAKIKSATRPDGNMHLEILPDKGQGLTFTLTEPLLFMFYNILTQGINQSGWGIGKEEEASMKIH